MCAKMAEPALEHLLTGEELLDLGDIGPCELIDGRLVPMPPTGGKHGTIEANIAFLLKKFVQSKALGWVLTGEVGIYTRRNPDRIRAADVAFVSRNQTKKIPSGFLEFAPELVIEIVSPSDRWQDIHQKIEEYFAIGIGSLWIVDPRSRSILVQRSPTEAIKYLEAQKLNCGGNLEGLEIPVSEIFRDVTA